MKPKTLTKKRCDDCRCDVSDEHYYVHPDIWFSVHPSERGFLCIGCLERRLGRILTPADFPPVSINKPQRSSRMSIVLAKRLGLVQ